MASAAQSGRAAYPTRAGGKGGSTAGPRPAPGPGEKTTLTTLRELWRNTGQDDGPVVGFYSHSYGPLNSFSNFYDQKDEPFEFEVPQSFLDGLQGRPAPVVVLCEFSEKAIMLCKAAVMGDDEAYHKIAEAREPWEAKSLGRSVKGFVPKLWDQVVCSVAFEAVYQKFAKTPSIQRVLLKTGDLLIAEATTNDANWGIGIDTWDPQVQEPSEWQGTNILGWALMEARAALRAKGGMGAPSQAPEAAPVTAPVAGAGVSWLARSFVSILPCLLTCRA